MTSKTATMPRKNAAADPWVTFKSPKLRMSTLNSILSKQYGMHIQKNPSK
jgi:hypothetical protein